MKNYEIAMALRSQQNETLMGSPEEVQKKRINLIEDVLIAEKQLYALGDERHLKSVLSPGERFDVLNQCTNKRLLDAFALYQIAINKKTAEAIKRFKNICNEFTNDK